MAKHDDLTWMDATAQAELVAKRTVSPLELVDAAIARIETANPKLNAVITPLFDKARAAARGALPAGPFRGVPFLLKDLICSSAGDPLHNGMSLLKKLGFVAPIDSNLGARFRKAGFVFVGKTNTPEMGIMPTTEPLAYGPTHNPWDAARTPGGSSGGSAAAVAAGMVPVAHANDGGGSIRIPASCCGLVGLKPSRGRVSLGPLVGEAWSGLACELVVSRSVRDTAAVLDAVAGREVGDPYDAPAPARPYSAELAQAPGRLRIGVLDRTHPGQKPLHGDCVAAVRDAAKLLESLGHLIEPKHPAALDDPEMTNMLRVLISAHTAASVPPMEAMLGKRLSAADFEPWTWAMIEEGRGRSAIEFVLANDWINGYTRGVAQFFADGYDLLLTPTLAMPPPLLGSLLPDPGAPLSTWQKLVDFIPFTPAQNLTGQPAIQLPLHWNAAGLPIGVQLVSAYGREDLLLRVAAQLETARPWKDRHPPLSA
jgi:amidase